MADRLARVWEGEDNHRTLTDVHHSHFLSTYMELLKAYRYAPSHRHERIWVFCPLQHVLCHPVQLCIICIKGGTTNLSATDREGK